MPPGIAMHEDVIEHEELTQGIRALNDATTELGIGAENAFKEAAEALFGQEPEILLSVRAARIAAREQGDAIHRAALGLLARAPGSGAAMRRIVELQQTAVGFRRIAEHAAQIAEQAQALGGSSERLLRQAACADEVILRRIVRQTYLQIRGAVIICATRDTARARLLLREQATLVDLSTSLKRMIETAIRMNPHQALQAFPLQQIVLVSAEMEAIGARAAGICAVIVADS